MKKLLLILLLLLLLVSSVSADILLVNPTSDTEIYKTGVNQTFSTLREAATGTGAVTTLQFVSIVGDNQVNKYSAFYRFGASYDTSPIGTGTVNSVKFGWKNLAKDNKQGNLGINVTTFIPASFTMVNAGANYNKFGSTSLANWNYADVVTSASTYNNASLTGLTINKTGYTALGMLVSADLSGNEGELTWLVGKGNSGFRPYTKAYAATGTFLEIDYTGDTTPPDSITELTNTTATNCSSINWTWTNPTDADFNHTYVLKNNVWYDNLSNTTTYSLWTGLTASTLYEIATHTVDLTGNMNTTWVNASYTLPACGVAPVASFTSDQTSGTEPLPVLLTDTSTNTPTAWNYSFNNVTGNNTVVWFSTAQNPVITLGVGNFSFALNASNAYGYNLSTQITWVNVSVIPTPPVAAFTPTGVVTGITSVTQAFADTSTNSSTAWEYGFLNSTGNNSWTGFATTQNPTYTFGIGNFSINLTVSNTFGSNTSTQSTWINVSYVPTPPVAAFSANTTAVCMGTEFRDYVQFTDASTNTPTSWFWLFGSGGVDSHLQNPVTNTFDTVGLWNVSLQATNDDGSDWENKTGYITVSDCTPVAAFSANNLTICQGTDTQFTDASTNTPTSWYWMFGDGNTSTTQNPLKIYDVVGLMNVYLNASNTYGFDWENKTAYINVTACAAPIPTPTPTPTPTTTVPTPTPAPVGCVFTNISGITVDVNNTNWAVTSGGTTWGVMNISNTSISYYRCGNAKLTTGGSLPSYVNTPLSPLLGLLAVMGIAFIIIRKK